MPIVRAQDKTESHRGADNLHRTATVKTNANVSHVKSDMERQKEKKEAVTLKKFKLVTRQPTDFFLLLLHVQLCLQYATTESNF